MRFPDIPLRHRRLVRSVAAVGTGALALVRRRDVSPEYESALRFGTSLANAGLTWVAGTRAFAEPVGGELNFGELFSRSKPEVGAPARYATFDGPSFDGDESPFEAEAANARAFGNITTAAASGVISWTLWSVTQNFADAFDAKLPAGVGRWLGAATSGGVVALGAVVLDKLEEIDAGDGQALDYAPVEIDLPDHIRDSVRLLLSQPHPVSQTMAEAVSQQFESARFFVWVTYSRTEYPGDEPISLDADQLAELLADEDIGHIDVYPASSNPTVIPETQTYPVAGVRDAKFHDPGCSAEMELSLDIVNGRLSALRLSPSVADADASGLPPVGSSPGTLHPDGLEGHSEDAGYWSSLEITEDDEEETLLWDWPRTGQLRFRTDGE